LPGVFPGSEFCQQVHISFRDRNFGKQVALDKNYSTILNYPKQRFPKMSSFPKGSVPGKTKMPSSVNYCYLIYVNNNQLSKNLFIFILLFKFISLIEIGTLESRLLLYKKYSTILKLPEQRFLKMSSFPKGSVPEKNKDAIFCELLLFNLC